LNDHAAVMLIDIMGDRRRIPEKETREQNGVAEEA